MIQCVRSHFFDRMLLVVVGLEFAAKSSAFSQKIDPTEWTDRGYPIGPCSLPGHLLL